MFQTAPKEPAHGETQSGALDETIQRAHTFHMESNEVSQEEAVRALRDHDLVLAKQGQSRVSREGVWITAWAAVITVTFVAVDLFLIAPGSPATVPSYPLLAPLLISSGLTNGALERFGVRVKPASPVAWLIIFAFACFVALTGLSVFQVEHPRILDLAAVLLLSGGFAWLTIRQLRRSTRDENSTWLTPRLSRATQITTCGVGVVLGALVATTPLDMVAATITAMIAMISLATMLLLWQSRYGLGNAGFEWRRIHWTAFGVSVTITFTATILVSFDKLSPPLAIAGGIATAAIMVGASFARIGVR